MISAERSRILRDITRDDKKKLTLRKLKLLFNCQYLRQFFIKLSNQGQFQNPQEKQIPKLSLVVRFDKELMEILTVKEKASVFEVSTFFCRRVYIQEPNLRICCIVVELRTTVHWFDRPPSGRPRACIRCHTCKLLGPVQIFSL